MNENFTCKVIASLAPQLQHRRNSKAALRHLTAENIHPARYPVTQSDMRRISDA